MNTQTSFDLQIVNEIMAVRAAESRIARGLHEREDAAALSNELTGLKNRLARLEALLAAAEDLELQVA